MPWETQGNYHGCTRHWWTRNSISFTWRYHTRLVDQDCHLSSLNHVTYVTLMFMIVALLFMLRQPEKTWPERFDIIDGSHQLLHIAVIFAQTLELCALYTDFLSGSNQHCQPNVLEILIELGTIAGVGLVVLLIFRSKAFAHLKDS